MEKRSQTIWKNHHAKCKTSPTDEKAWMAAKRCLKQIISMGWHATPFTRFEIA